MRLIYLAVALFFAVSACQQPVKEDTQQQTTNLEGSKSTIETILSRRSIRAYKSEQIKKGELDQIIACAINAPSALNKQPWEIRVIQNPELIKAINDGFVEFSKGKEMQGSASRVQEPGFSVFHGAPTVIVVAHDTKSSTSQVDCGLLGQNILLSAEAQGIGTCVVGGVIGFLSTPEAGKLVSQLNLSEGYKPLYTITVGYKDQEPEAKPRDISKISVIE